MAHAYEYPRPMVTVDALIFRDPAAAGPPEVLLIRRKRPPFEGMWAIPGGFVEIDEDLEPAAHRELEEETGISGLRLEQLRTYGRPGRDPRGRTISVVYAGTCPPETVAEGRDDAAEARWFKVEGEGRALPPMAFDHAEIVKDGIRWLAGRRGQDGRGPRA